MFDNNRTGVTSILQSLINVDTSFHILTFLEQDPSISIQIGIIGRFCLNGLIAHLLCLIQVFPFYRQVISIIVQCTNIVWFIHQSRIVGSISLSIHLFDVIQIAHDGIEIRSHVLVTIRSYLSDTFLKYLQSLIMLFLLVMGYPPIVIELQCFGHIFHSRCTQTNHLIQIFLRDCKTQ